MKRIFICLLLAAATLSVAAQEYTHAIGAQAGGFNGFSYKGFILPVKGLAIQADLGFRLAAMGPLVAITKSWDGYREHYNDNIHRSDFYWTFEMNPNIVYQGNIAHFGDMSLSWFVGGGTSLGMMRVAETYYGRYHYGRLAGKFGLNTIGGAELSLGNIPLNFTFDFRPGYGLGFCGRQWSEDGYVLNPAEDVSFFDWSISAGVYYRL